ncbi:hypothetical protein DFJ73DRAFT_858895 [Zopfochytrium polystomum]|nr:hypothetical protein DFJ73DRAFT_858895 [Zopfochytrium polystomum]
MSNRGKCLIAYVLRTAQPPSSRSSSLTFHRIPSSATKKPNSHRAQPNPAPFHGSRAERFPKLPPLRHVGPGSYDVDEITTLSKVVTSKPSSKLGVCINTTRRFPPTKEIAPSPDCYQLSSFVDVLDTHISSRRGTLNTLEDNRTIETMLRRMTPVPGPGSYDVNHAIGRHVANDKCFALLKSNKLSKRDALNRKQVSELERLLAADDLFTDKTACRRMAHLSLYFP